MFNINEKSSNIQIISAIIYFGYLLYYIGRRYTEGYHETLNIPPDLLNLSVADFIYRGAHPFPLILAMIFVTLFVILINLFHIKTEKVNIETSEKDSFVRKFWNFVKQREKQDLISLLYFLIVFTWAIAWLVVFWSTAPIEPTQTEILFIAVFTIMLVLFAAIQIIIVWFDKKSKYLIRKSRFLRIVLIVGTAIILIAIPYVSGYGLGICLGYLDTMPDRFEDNFYQVELISEQPFNDELQWQVNTDGLYHSTDNLYLLLANNEFLFVTSEIRGQTFVIPRQSLLSFTLR